MPVPGRRRPRGPTRRAPPAAAAARARRGRGPLGRHPYRITLLTGTRRRAPTATRPLHACARTVEACRAERRATGECRTSRGLAPRPVWTRLRVGVCADPPPSARSPRKEEPVILVAGATGQLGGLIARRLLARGEVVRILVRPGSDDQPLVELGAQPMFGDLKDPPSLAAACQGVSVVLTTADSAARGGADTVETVVCSATAPSSMQRRRPEWSSSSSRPPSAPTRPARSSSSVQEARQSATSARTG
nr:MAG: hypothetical protein DIU52_05850 [bacterium]